MTIFIILDKKRRRFCGKPPCVHRFLRKFTHSRSSNPGRNNTVRTSAYLFNSSGRSVWKISFHARCSSLGTTM